MAHAKQQIRAAVVTALTGLTTTGSNVYSTRVFAHDALPSLNVTAGDEDAGPVQHDGTQQRTLEVIVEIRATKATGWDGQADTIQAEVEAAIHADYRLGGLCIHCALTGVTDEPIENASRAGLLRTLVFGCLYSIDPSAPETLVN